MTQTIRDILHCLPPRNHVPLRVRLHKCVNTDGFKHPFHCLRYFRRDYGLVGAWSMAWVAFWILPEDYDTPGHSNKTDTAQEQP